MRRIHIIFAVFCGCAAAVTAMEISRAQVNSVKIHVAADASSVEQYAAGELQRFLEASTGTALGIVRTPWAGRSSIHVGASEVVRKLLPEVDFDAMEPDEILIRRLASDDLVIAGGSPRGTLYAVYTFLEDFAGIRFWSPTETDIPHRDRITVADVDIRYRPVITARDTFTHSMLLHPEFAARLKNNGDGSGMAMAPYGGNVEIIGLVHTFDRYIPAARYLDAHPEWFSLVDGKRVGGQHVGQLCLTNEAMRQELTANMLEILRRHPDPRIIDLSQNDGGSGLCECAACQEVIAAEGAPSGLLLRFVNRVAEDIRREFPGVKVMTLAYFFTADPPRLTRPADNVIVRLCTPECTLSYPLDSGQNDRFRRQLRAWGDIAAELAVWHYQINFSAYLLPFPNIRHFGDDIRFLAQNRVKSILLQNDYGSGGVAGDLMALRTWINAKLLWNPELDARQLLEEFTSGYYGPAAGPRMLEYIDFLEGVEAVNGGRLDFLAGGPSDWLSHADLARAEALMEQALAAAEGQPEYRRRVEIAALSVKMAWLNRYHWILLFQELPPEELPMRGDIDAYTRYCFELAEKCRANFYSEELTLAAYKAELQQQQRILTQPVPEEFAGYPAGTVLAVEPSMYTITERPARSVRIADPASRSGEVLQMSRGSEDWFLYILLYNNLAGQRWRVLAYCRAETDDPKAPALKVGVYGRSDKITQTAYLPGERFSPGEYRWIDCGVWELPDRPQLFFAPVGNDGFRNVFIDQVVLIRE